MKTTDCSDAADYIWLTGSEARQMLTELAAECAPLHTLVTRLRGRLPAGRTHLLLEQVDLRRRAAAKFSQAANMFFTRLGLEQATDEWVAAHKAARFAQQQTGPALCSRSDRASLRIADLCCGIGGDLISLTATGAAIGVDRDPMTAHFAAVNSGADVQAIDVAEFDLRAADAFHIDPDRRATGNRTTRIEAFEPNVEVIGRLLRQAPDAAVKLAPATKAPVDWENRCELEWISRDGECRQLVAWHGRFAHSPGKHTATILSSSSSAQSSRTITGAPNEPVGIVQQTDRYVFDVDAAVLAAHLKGVLAARHSLGALSAGAAYLTGPRPIADPALACFEVMEILPMEARKLARHLAERRIGRLEIKKRGVELDLDKLRRELKLRGDNSASLLLARMGDRNVAILARRTS